MCDKIGKKVWIIPDCELPREGEGVAKGHESVIIVNGTRNFIRDINRKINLLERDKKTSIEQVDCYLFDEVKNQMYEIRNQYDSVLNNLQKNT